MGAWGPGLFSDDVACDVKEYYMNCLREEMSADEAEAAVVSYFGDELADSDDGPVVVLALADTAWRVGRLSEKLKEAAIRNNRYRGRTGKMGSRRKAVVEKAAGCFAET